MSLKLFSHARKILLKTLRKIFRKAVFWEFPQSYVQFLLIKRALRGFFFRSKLFERKQTLLKALKHYVN